MSAHAADRLGKWLAIGGTLLALTAIVLGIRAMGSPAEQRQVRIDARRIDELGDVERVVREYAKAHDALPASIAQVVEQGGVRLPAGPETGAAYEYARIDAGHFRLCATFTTDTAQQRTEAYPARSPQWQHGVGRQCFARKLKVD